MEDKIKFYEIANILDLDLEYDGDETDLRLHGEEKLNWGAETNAEYEEATNAIDAISYKGNGWEVYATYDVSGFDYWMLQQEEPNYINMTIMFDNDTVDVTEITAIKNAIDMAYSDAYSIAEKYDYVPNSEYKRGGKVDGRSTRAKDTWNRGSAWTRDRNAHNKSEDWEKPMNKRKYAEGGGVDTYYRVFDTQRGVYFATGYNATSMDELIEDFQSYILGASEIDFEHEQGTSEYEKELTDFLGTWDLIAEHLQGVELEESSTPFEDEWDEYKRGGKVDGRSTRAKDTWNRGSAWTRDRNAHNKSEDWEKPLNKRGKSVTKSISSSASSKSSSSASKDKSKKYMYIPNYMIRGAEVNNSGKTTDIDGANILDGIYVKKGTKYADGGGVPDLDKKMALINLDMIHEYSVKLDNMVTEETELEEWVKMKLTRIEQNVADVKHAVSGGEKFDKGGMIFKKQLLHISKYAKELIDMIQAGSNLMAWQENKLAIAADNIDGIYHYMDYLENENKKISDAYLPFADGGGVSRNVGRDWLFKSKQDWEQKYDRKREYKEYKKEGWLANWFKEGGEAEEFDFEEFRKRQAIISEAVKFAFVRAIGFDEAYNLLQNEDLSISPYRLVERAVSGEFIGVHEINKDVVESAIDEAREVTNRYKDSGQGIGSSDMTAFLKNFLDGAGFKTAFISSRLERIDENGNAIKVKSDLPNTTMFKEGGRVKNYKYVPNYMIESVDVERNGKTTEIDGGNILDGLYVKNTKFEEGGYVENIPTKTLESMIGRKLNGWNDDKVIFNGVVYKKCFMKPYYKIA
jgi:hypothetical protein